MRTLAFASAALVTMTLTAAAADLPRKAPPPAPPPAPVYDWNGFYIGVMGGFGASDRTRLTVGGADFTTSGNLRGGFFGGTIGYNFAPVGGSWLLGIEADAAWANISNSATGAIPPFAALTVGDRIDAIGSVTGRLGWRFGPGLLYAKGGWAWAENTLSATLVTGGIVAPPVAVSASERHLHSGWTVGGGMEYLFAQNWSGKIEYMYADYGSATYAGGLVPGGIGLGATVHTIKGGINYHFNWGNLGPVVARY